jgi:uncharacterized membrane protein
MKSGIKPLRILFTLILMFLITTDPITVLAASGEYYISNITINAAIDKQGNMSVEESYDYVFKGSFNGIKRNIKTKGSDGVYDVAVNVVSNNQVTKGNFEVNKSGTATEVKIYSKSSSETKTFKINYKLKNVITQYSDAAELKWLFYENEDNVATNKITVYLTLPNPINEEVKYFGEGPKRGSASLENGFRIKLQLDNMKDEEVIGAQVLFPSNWVNTSKTISMNRDEYNTMLQKKRNKTLATVAISILGGTALITSLLYSVHKKRKEAIDQYRENYMFFNGQYCSQLPSNLSPALVSKLVTNRIDTKDLLATILHLANRGALTFLDNPMYDRDYDNLCFTINNYADTRYLLYNEKYLLDWLSHYGRGGAIYLTSLQKNASKSEFISKYGKWRNLVSEDATNLNFYTVIRGKRILTNEYEDERRKWRAFKQYLCDSGNSEILNLKELGLWDSIIPYAIALDIMENVLRFIPKNDTSYNSTNNMFMNYWFLHYYTSTYKRDFDKSYASGTSSSSDGNFSGGGGGGFGGGGGSSAF